MADFTPQEIEQFLQEFFDTVGARQYVGARYVPIFGRVGENTVEWDDHAPYEPLTVVMHQGVSYVSRRYVPADIPLTDTAYWVETYRFNAQVEQYRQEVQTFQGQIDDRVPFPDPETYPRYGTLGQVLSTLEGGRTMWADPVVPSDEQAEEVITAWLDEHPEATTTVLPGSITNDKIHDDTIADAKLVQSGGVLERVAKLSDAFGESVSNPPLFSIARTVESYGNLWDADNVGNGYYQAGTGAIVASELYLYSPTYVPVAEGDVIMFNNTRPTVCLYDAEGGVVSCTQPPWAGLTVPAGVAFARFSLDAANAPNMLIYKQDTPPGERSLPTGLRVPRAYASIPDGSVTDAKLVQSGGVLERVAKLSDAFGESVSNPPLFSIARTVESYGNLWDADNVGNGYYQAGTGAIVASELYLYSPTYVPVAEGDVIVFNNTRPLVCLYDAEGGVVSCTQPPWAGLTVPAGVAFARFSFEAAQATGMQIYKRGTSLFERTQKTALVVPRLRTSRPVIVASGTGDYASLTEALYSTTGDVVVMPGTYDIVAEYKALFGSDIFDTMTYQTEGMRNFQWGLYIDNRTVTFKAGARVTCDMSAYDNGVTRRFSPFNLAENATLDGLNCYAVNPYYVIHDDFGDMGSTFTNTIRNCVLVSPNPSNGNVIGGGCRKFSTKVVENCYLDNGTNSPVTMRYHNVNANGAMPTVIVRDTRCNNAMRMNRYGTQTSTKMVAIVNNCKASSIYVGDEASGVADNVVLYEWCNETA